MTERNFRSFGVVVGGSIIGLLLAGGAGLAVGGLIGVLVGVNLPQHDD